MAKPIPKEVLKVLVDDPFMTKCCITGSNNVQWHHNLIYGGRAVNEWWAILPVSPEIHSVADNKDIKLQLNRIMVKRAGGLEKKYEKVVKIKV